MTTYNIDKLTPEQEKEVEVWKEVWLAKGRLHGPGVGNREKSMEALIELYKDLGFEAPIFVFGKSPKEMCSFAELVKGMSDKEAKDVTEESLRALLAETGGIPKTAYNENLNNSWFIQWWSGWRVFYLFCREVLGLVYEEADSRKLDIWIGLCEFVHAFLAYDTHCFVSDYPTILKWDNRNRLHSEDGPALAYADGLEIFAAAGTRIKDPELIDLIFINPHKITHKEIDKNNNQEIRALLLRKLGFPAYIQQSKAKIVHEDEYGKLYEKPIPGTSVRGLFLGVQNSTPEPDGTIKEYILQCHPQLAPIFADGTFGKPQKETAHNAAASLFGLRGEEYHPLKET